MSTKERKRQQQLARKKRKRQEKKSIVKTSAAMGSARSAIASTRYPLNECLVPTGLFESGIGTIVISRILDNGLYATSVILLDVYCLGAKNAYFRLLGPDEYRQMVTSIRVNEDLQAMEASCTRKLVEECVKYAAEIGLPPHPDYQVAQQIFGDIEAQACSEVFEFGKDGKPLYSRGPNENRRQAEKIMRTLEQHCGPDGFHYIIGLDDDFN